VTERLTRKTRLSPAKGHTPVWPGSWLTKRFGLPVLALGLVSTGCAPGQFTTVTIYDTPEAFVRLEADRTVEKGREHSHPVNVTAEQIAAVLSGVMIEEPVTRLPLYDDTSRPRRHRVFSDHSVTLFAPLLAMGLGKATPEEVVTFYQSRELSGTSREVTSGGLFVREETLHLVLGNYRSSTHYSADIGVADTTDDRLTPMQPLAPQRGRLDFEPRSALQPVASSGWTRFLQTDRRELIILFRQLAPGVVTPPAPIILEPNPAR
jgi:hypothetical protein